MSRSAYGLLLRFYPLSFRARFGVEMLHAYRALRAEPRYSGVIGGLRLWVFLLRDFIASMARERAADLRPRTVRPAGRGRSANVSPPYFDAMIAGLAVFALYLATLAPSVAFWDAGEYMTAAHMLGIPHAPGNPLFVLLAHGWDVLLAPFGLSVAVRLNLFSALCSAAAHALWFLVIERSLRTFTDSVTVRRVTAAAAILLSASAFTVWNQSNVNEKVYTLSLFTIALVSWLLLRWRDCGRTMPRLLAIVFVIALSSTNHLMGVLVAPGVLLFLLLVDRRAVLQARVIGSALVVAALGLLPQFFLPYRANQRPVLAEAEPSCESMMQAVASVYTWGQKGCPALSGALRREQYGKPPVTMDPTVYPDVELPRGPKLFASQLVNWLQYLDWQWARSINGTNPVFGGVRPLFTLLFVLLAIAGLRLQWRHDRATAAYLLTLFLMLSFGLVVYLNFKYGYALERVAFPDLDAHEVRERDYFFIAGFSVFGLWCGLGVVAVWRWLAARLEARITHPRVLAAPVLALAIVPLGLNWQWASRSGDYAARDWAYNVLMSIQPYGVLFTNGDNDTFPLWYLQEVEGIRRDVTVMVTSYLNTPWYARQVRDLTRPCAAGQSAELDPTRIICQRAFKNNDLPPQLAQRAKVIAPDDSILPMSDAEIDRIVANPFVTREALSLHVGALQATIPSGTVILPADTFVAAILNASLGKRPIYFAAPNPTLQKLGLSSYSVRTGLTLALPAAQPDPEADPNVIALPENGLSPVAGGFVDLATTDTLLHDVFLQRGRLLNPKRAWVDRATTNILLQYAWAHYTVAEALSLTGKQVEADHHIREAEWWQRVAGE